MEQPAAANERTGRRPIRWPPERLPLHSRSFRRSRSLSPYRHDDDDNDDDANGHALSRPAGRGGVSGGELSLVNATAPTTRAEEPTALSRPRWNAPPMERGSEANIPLPFNRSEDCDYGAVMQKLRTMDYPEMMAYVEAEMAKLVVRKGEFGWLDDERVNEIGEIVKKNCPCTCYPLCYWSLIFGL